MDKVAFTYYLRDDFEQSELADYLVERQGLPLDLAEHIAEQRPFYEVTLECEYDTVTGKVEIVSVK